MIAVEPGIGLTKNVEANLQHDSIKRRWDDPGGACFWGWSNLSGVVQRTHSVTQ